MLANTNPFTESQEKWRIIGIVIKPSPYATKTLIHAVIQNDDNKSDNADNKDVNNDQDENSTSIGEARGGRE